MTKYEQLKKVIQTANPEIMEVQIGCEGVDRFGNDWIYIRDGWCGKDKQMWSAFEPDKILGRPIRLADVLLALGKIDSNSSIYYGVNANGGLLKEWCEKTVWNEESDEPILWNLKDDNLDNQSDETKQFLIKLMVQ